ncbi:MAG TPA: hypothetical protein VNB91_13440 [Jatrophihabitantaceae bacterium]|jgi:hypothetical protein|nr:hypothetical protein [Jatrophihabitantaceae bacterium]
MSEPISSGSTWDEDKLLISAISRTNPRLGYYALRLVDVDAGQARELPVREEIELGATVEEIGQRIRQRAGRRSRGTPC